MQSTKARTSRKLKPRTEAFALYRHSGLDANKPKGPCKLAAAVGVPLYWMEVGSAWHGADVPGCIINMGRGWEIYVAKDLLRLARIHTIYHELGHWWLGHTGHHWSEFGPTFLGEEHFVNAMAETLVLEIDGYEVADLRAAVESKEARRIAMAAAKAVQS